MAPAEMIYDSITSWCTQTSLFIVIHLVIAIIAVMGKIQQTQQQQHQVNDESTVLPPHQLSRDPSLVSRVSSFSYFTDNYDSSSYLFMSEEETDDTQTMFPLPSPSSSITEDPNPSVIPTPSLLSRMTSFSKNTTISQSDLNPSNNETVVIKSSDQQHPQMERTASEQTEAVEEAAAKMRKTASDKTAEKKVAPSDQELVWKSVTRTERVMRNRARVYDEEVDAKAYDFINQFKHQLRLERLDSLLRYRNSSSATSSTQLSRTC